MKPLAAFALIFGTAFAVSAAVAQEKPDTASERAAEPAEEGEHGKLELWKWANFIVLAGGLGYLAGKHSGPFFAARSIKIRKDLIESEEVRKEAEARVAAVERRIANLEADIAALRAEAQKEAEAETERLSRRTAAEIAKAQAHGEEEIAAAGKAARASLKQYAAELAVELAEQKIRTRITPDEQNALVRGFAHDLPAAGQRVRNT